MSIFGQSAPDKIPPYSGNRIWMGFILMLAFLHLSCSGEERASSITPIWSSTYEVKKGCLHLEDVDAGTKRVAAIGTGSIFGVSHGSFVVVLMYDSKGDLLWSRSRFGDSMRGYSEAGGIAFGRDGDIFIACMEGGCDGSSKCVVAKYSSTGALLWEWKKKMPFDNYAAGRDIDADAQGGVVVVGEEGERASNALTRAFIVRLNAAGKTQWDLEYRSREGESSSFRKVTLDSGGEVAVAGYATESASSLDGYWLIRKYRRDGQLLWSRSRTMEAQKYWGTAGVALCPGHDLVHLWFRKPVGSQVSIWHLDKYLPSGRLLWSRTYALAGSYDSFARSLAVNRDCSVYACGEASVDKAARNSRWLVVKLNREGNLSWVYRYGWVLRGNDSAGAIAVDPEGSVIIAGTERASWWDRSATRIRIVALGKEIEPGGRD